MELIIPEPKRGGTLIYCPHATVELVKVPKKKAKEVITHCVFKTRNIRKYRRHFKNMHGPARMKPEANLGNVEAKIAESQAKRQRTPRYSKGDSRRKND